MKEEVEFHNVPKDFRAKSTNTHIKVEGLVATKEVTRTYTIPGGTTETRKAELKREFAPLAKVDIVA